MVRDTSATPGSMGWSPSAKAPGYSGRVCSFFFQAEDGIRYLTVTGVQTCALPISPTPGSSYNSAPTPAAGAPTPGAMGGPTPYDSGPTPKPYDAPTPGYHAAPTPGDTEIGRGSCRERV